MINKQVVINSLNYHFFLFTNRSEVIPQFKLDLLFYKLWKFNRIDLNINSFFLENEKNFNETNYFNSTFSLHSKTPFVEFFKTQNIDVPLCFNKSKSLRRSKSNFELLNFSNYIFKRGLKNRVLKQLIRLFNYEGYNFYQNKTNLGWQTFYLFYSYFSYSKANIQNYVNYTNLLPRNITFDSKSTKNILFYKNITSLYPLFLLYIYKVDKTIFKNSRGRSGKFTFIWKYIPPYKRKNLVYHWLAKDFKTINRKSFTDRLDLLINRVTRDLDNTLIYKVRKFSYNYIYLNSRHTLGRTYRTVTK